MTQILEFSKNTQQQQNQQKSKEKETNNEVENIYDYMYDKISSTVEAIEEEGILNENLMQEDNISIFKDNNNVKILGIDSQKNQYVIFKNIQGVLFISNEQGDISFHLQGKDIIQSLINNLKEQQIDKNSLQVIDNIDKAINQSFFDTTQENHQELFLNKQCSKNQIFHELEKYNFMLEGLNLTNLEQILFDEDSGYRLEMNLSMCKKILIHGIDQYQSYLESCKQSRYANSDQRSMDKKVIKEAENCEQIANQLFGILDKFQKVEKLVLDEDYEEDEKIKNDFEKLENLYQSRKDQNHKKVFLQKYPIKIFKSFSEQYKLAIKKLVNQFRDGSENLQHMFILSLQILGVIEQYIQQQQIKQQKIEKKQKKLIKKQTSFSEFDSEENGNNSDAIEMIQEEEEQQGESSQSIQPIQLDDFVFQKNSEKKPSTGANKFKQKFNTFMLNKFNQ